MPVGWERHNSPAGALLPHYYCNELLGKRQWEHPALTHWRSVLSELRAMEAKQQETGADLELADLGPALWVEVDDQMPALVK